MSLFRGSNRTENSRAAALEAYCEDRPELRQALDWERLLTKYESYTPQAADDQAAHSGDFESGRAQWEARREATIAGASKPQAEAVTAIAQGTKAPAPGVAAAGDTVTSDKTEGGDGEVSYRRGRAATNLGRAVHAVLQSIDLETGAGLEDICRAQATAEGIGHMADEVIELSRNALDMTTVKDLVELVGRDAASYYREVFVSAKLGDRLVEGFIDLLIDEPEGVSIVDYKTDRLSPKQVQELGPEYEIQLGLYAWAVAETTKRPVKRATLLFLRPEEERRYPDADALISKAKAAAEK